MSGEPAHEFDKLRRTTSYDLGLRTPLKLSATKPHMNSFKQSTFRTQSSPALQKESDSSRPCSNPLDSHERQWCTNTSRHAMLVVMVVAVCSGSGGSSSSSSSSSWSFVEIVFAPESVQVALEQQRQRRRTVMQQQGSRGSSKP